MLQKVYGQLLREIKLTLSLVSLEENRDHLFMEQVVSSVQGRGQPIETNL